MSSDGTGERLPNGLPAEFAHAPMTGNLIQGTFADAPHWAEPDPNWAGSEQQTINICIDHPELGVRVLGVLTWGGDVDLAHAPQAAPSAESTPATPNESNRPTTASITGDSRKPGYTPEMQAAYDDFKRIDPDASDQYIDELIRYRFRDGTDRVASINRLLHFKDDVQKQREQIDPKEYEVSYETIKQVLSDPHTYLSAASFIPEFGSIAMLLDGALYQYQGDQESARSSYTAAMLGIVTGDAGFSKLGLKGAKVVGKVLNEGGHAAEVVADAAKAEKLATKATTEADDLLINNTTRGHSSGNKQDVNLPHPTSDDKDLSPRSATPTSQDSKDLAADAKPFSSSGDSVQPLKLTMRGTSYEMPDWYLKPTNFTKISPQANDLARSQFAPVRERFIKELAHSHAEELKRAGINNNQIAGMKSDGVVPEGFQVHHLEPVGGGGNHSTGNLVLIRINPDHRLLNAYQSRQTAGLKVGESATFDWPFPKNQIKIWPEMPQSGARPVSPTLQIKPDEMP